MTGRNFVVVASLSTLVGCGGDGGGGPITPSPTPTGLSITPATDLIRIRSSETFSLSVSFSDGTSRAVQATWGSDAPSVATVDSSGRATGVASGQATVSADYQGQRATRLLRVVPDYQGRWQGDWRITACAEEGDWLGACSEFAVGSLWELSTMLTQNRDALTGTTDFGDDLPGPVTGTIRMSGHLVLNGTYTIVVEGTPLEITVSDWETITSDNERMTGQFRLTFLVSSLQGALRIDGELRIVAKTSTTPALTRGAGAGGFGRVLAQLLHKR